MDVGVAGELRHGHAHAPALLNGGSVLGKGTSFHRAVAHSASLTAVLLFGQITGRALQHSKEREAQPTGAGRCRKEEGQPSSRG